LSIFVLIIFVASLVVKYQAYFLSMQVLGPMANNVNQQFGNYNPDIMPIYTTTPLDGLKGLSETTNYAPGCPDNRCMKYNSSVIKTAVQDVELVVVCLGTGLYIIFTSYLQWYEVIF